MENLEKQQEQPEQINGEQLKEKITLIYHDPEKYDKLCEFVGKLKAKYSDYHDYKFYHFLIRSTLRHELPKMDFPGEDSVENFINSLSA